MKTAHQNYITNRYPLIELGMRRFDCLKWLEAHDYPIPPNSSCLGCPYHDNKYWRALKRESPDEWADTVAMDRMLRLPGVSAMVGTEYMHRNRVPLEEADLELELETQMDLFGEECEGVCGV